MLIVSLFSDKHIFNLLSSLFMVNLRVLASLSLTIKLISLANKIGIEGLKQYVNIYISNVIYIQ